MNSLEVGPVVAAGAAAVVTGWYFWMKSGGHKKPSYENDDTWFKQERDGTKGADVFYVHPTTHIGFFRWNMGWENMSTCTGPIGGDADLLIGQAGAWSGSCNLWAPKYRQMGFLSMGKNLSTADEALLAEVKSSIDMAYEDVSNAFQYFLEHRPDKTRPFILAGHSQGAILLSKVLSDHIEGTKHEKQFVAAYLCGSYLPADLFGTRLKSIHACNGPEDLRCVIAYDTRTAVFDYDSMHDIGFGIGFWGHLVYWLLHDRYCERPEGKDSVNKDRTQINPMTWKATGGGEHLGVEKDRRKLVPPAGYGENVVVTSKAVVVPDFDSWAKGLDQKSGPGNLHPVDVQFWYHNIVANVTARLEAWKRNA